MYVFLLVKMALFLGRQQHLGWLFTAGLTTFQAASRSVPLSSELAELIFYSVVALDE